MFLGTDPDIVYGVADKKAFISITKTDNLLVDTDLEKRNSRYYHAYGRSVPHFANSGIAKKRLQDGTTIGGFHYTSTIFVNYIER